MRVCMLGIGIGPPRHRQLEVVTANSCWVAREARAVVKGVHVQAPPKNETSNFLNHFVFVFLTNYNFGEPFVFVFGLTYNSQRLMEFVFFVVLYVRLELWVDFPITRRCRHCAM